MGFNSGFKGLTGRRFRQFVIMYVGLPADIRSLQYGVLVCLQYGVLVCLKMTGARCCKHVGNNVSNSRIDSRTFCFSTGRNVEFWFS